MPHPDPLSHLPLDPIPLALPSAPALSTCLMHPTWAGDLFHPRQYTCFIEQLDAAERSYPTSKVRVVAALCRSSREEIPQVQSKRNPSKMVGTERGHQRTDRLKPQSQTTSQSEHMDHSLSNSMKLNHAVWGHPSRMGHGGEV